MRRGHQLIAPEGYLSLHAGTPYHFLCSQPEHVLLLQFSGGPTVRPSVRLIRMPRTRFEEGIEQERLTLSQQQPTLPPWLAAFEGIDPSTLDYQRHKVKHSRAARVEDRLLLLTPALAQAESILVTEDPNRELNQIARSCHPRQNETRYRLWFYAYLCFGQNMWVLLPTFHHNGHHDRRAYPDSKQGRPNLAFGKHYGFGCRQDVIDACLRGWVKHSELGRSLRDIYRRTMHSEFQCKAAPVSLGALKAQDYIQPDGKAFPTYWQFRYRVQAAFGLRQVQLSLYGELRYRNKLAASQGRYSETVANLVERIDADGYFTEERPKGFIEGSTLPALCVIVGRDRLSGMKLGIGFSFGSEQMRAYRAMLFCMAVPKDFYCSLYGITIDPDQWPNEGLPGFPIVDRGPGGSKRLIEKALTAIPIREMAPSYTPQSKATVESSHPRKVALRGAPSYVQSDLTPVELAKQEIYRLLNYNHVADMSERFQPIGDLAQVLPNPIGLWEYYDRKGRNDSIPIPLPAAVRAFLTPVELTMTEEGVWLYEQCYNSPALRASDLLDKLKRSSKTRLKVQGYLLEMCVRHLWVDVDGVLYLLDAMLRMREDEDLLLLSHEELRQWHEARRAVDAAFRSHQDAVTTGIMLDFEADVGKSWEAGQRRRGKPKHDATAHREFAEVRKYVSGGKVG